MKFQSTRELKSSALSAAQVIKQGLAGDGGLFVPEEIPTLTFEEIDTNRYPCFPLVLQAAKMGDNYPCALSAANEEAVKMFLQGRIRFTDIYGYLADCLDLNLLKGDGYDVLKEVDRAARSRAISRFSAKNA